MIFGFWKRYKEQQRANLRRRGFDYAAGRLLADGILARAILESQIENAFSFNEDNEFDKGIQDALRKHHERSQK